MEYYCSDKPDIRFEMKIKDLTSLVKGKGFTAFNDSEYVGGICAEGCGEYTRKQLDALTEFVKRSQIGAKGLVYAKVNADGTVKSSVDKFFSQEELTQWIPVFGAKPGDLLLILWGDKFKTLTALSA
jgi:aspartyl-tRNA synthetase